ncbi:hypothetical protein NSA02_03445 [Ligilactobacillus murinus]|uniref:hypothetical protein n=1 Tax=Ligilactobacillus murinus TaxID=1622 RepID=UPI00214C6C46|nr:hypothetical protein [Ligilactobacillus murinus]MCR1895865.1 hypothetical protein [Ligilactobacillus murinus]
MIKEFKPIKRPSKPMPLDVKIELGYLMHNNFSADRVFQDCLRLVKCGKSDFVSSETAASWIVEYESVFCRAFMEHWDLDDPPKYWIGDKEND